MKKVKMTIAKKIRLLRQRQGLSQEQVATKLNISVPALSKIESGVTDINISRVEQLAASFGLSLMTFLEWDGESEPGSNLEFNILTQKLIERETQLIELQNKVIFLLEALKGSET